MSGFGTDPSLVTNMIYSRIGFDQDLRLDGLIHASSATREKPRWCPRAFAIQTKHKIPPLPERIPPLLKLTFDQGNDKQARINNEYLRDVMVGKWRCSVCGHTTGVQKPPKSATPCGHSTDHYEYKEVSWRAKDSLLVGSTDMLIEVSPKDKLLMVECKIITPNTFKELVRPLAEHVWRTRLYLWLIANSDSPYKNWVNTDFAHVLYCNRAYGAKIDGKMTAYREFRVDRNDTEVEALIAKVQSASDCLTNGGDLPEGICTEHGCYRASKCSVRDICFGVAA